MKALSKRDYIKKSGMNEKGRDDGPHNYRKWLGIKKYGWIDENRGKE